jgi:tetratricopeptide (TPR) repeat protein
MLRARLLLGCCLALGFVVYPNWALAQPMVTPASAGPVKPSSARQALLEAFEKSKVAKTADEITPIIETCEKALVEELTPANQAYAHQLAAWAYNRRGELYAEQAAAFFDQGQERKANEFDALALAEFEAALQHDPQRWKALHNRGVSLALHGRLDEAFVDFNKVIELNKDYVNAWFNRAELLRERRQFADAIKDYDEALKRNANDELALVGRGTAYLGAGQPQKGAADLDRALSINAKNGLALCRRGDIRQQLKQWNAAAEDYRQAIQLGAKNADAYRGAAWLMATCPEERFRNPELALKSAQKAVELAGEQDFEALDALAAAQANAGDFATAAATIARALLVAPADLKEGLESRQAAYQSEMPYRQ